ncbi:hypothetical protein A3D05_04230 [Candidatus Gottesmanbacteria bacterium RIFCSPHIGHO2_02_FULL_40_24]|uniref:Zinc finger DksA/TraR C4-type domain-containing protein n=1 Tax=Candidatus Gottesmanbacteria bacterium RIFCSPHIGHO2_01_FULL_40_15 TaxID=1798376 RepID=A0A1F5Z0U6_9BACT|nr:MAG: hypothetical protein A2777_01020 [Candidatus Gottesmanbacteria bacterium RIFCSPHIGHO2_01_FULL_40_15]OGG17510.1 MAG: hypothetical protein A3D05_04230 [Candidatus Gottesmanbacteria bacterium RIFCSPHIGHO2_02_FULL_40_24]OGG25153.1 MAG: hypothetical protein A3E42_01145 [Candidatus Gottesmanbacteria bacterium RIFCSPHIGHO2_12_FULL_40_13]OGG32728.1 MAG: hypothetical protein A3I80_00175 [Candidatus Gottesmanbacteria bacterium RIFCSPLOWO2_02_FULL_40_10]
MKFPKAVMDNVSRNLIKLRKTVEERIHSLKLQDPFSDPERLNDNAASDTEAKEESSHERMEALEKELRAHLEEINLTLQRIKKGTYGKCQNCGKMIDTDRLAIKPTALYCVDCERKKEK